MTIKICYVQSIPSINGRESLRGRRLVDHLRREFDVELIDGVVEQQSVAAGLLSSNDFTTRNFDVLYLEGGAFWGTTWKVPEEVVRGFIADGGVLIAADADRNEAGMSRDASPYQRAGDLFHAYIDWGTEGGGVLYGIDPVDHWNQEGAIFATPDQMAYDDRWLEPVYDGIDRILVLQPVVLRTVRASALATGNRGTSQVLSLDNLLDTGWPFTFASVDQSGLGFAVLIAGSVSHDVIFEACPDNARWISNIVRFLTDEVSRERERRGAHQLASEALTLGDAEWASALGHLSALHNAVERRLRGLIANRLLDVERVRGEVGWALARIAAALPAQRREEVSEVSTKGLERLYWLELVAIVKRDWAPFQAVFGDRPDFARRAEIVNDRPHAHAKSLDRADLALYRRELEWFRTRLDAADH